MIRLEANKSQFQRLLIFDGSEDLHMFQPVLQKRSYNTLILWPHSGTDKYRLYLSRIEWEIRVETSITGSLIGRPVIASV